MVFSSVTFLCVFLPAVFVLSRILPGTRAKNVMLTAASLVFYAYGEPVYVLLMLASAGINYGLGLLAGKAGRAGAAAAAAAVAANLGILGVFKYAGFFCGLIAKHLWAGCPVPQLVMPIGISFYTFQALSYVIDVRRGECAPQKNFGKLLLYITFFPQLIAGPIVKYHDIEEQISRRSQTAQRTADGLRRFVIGLSKKVLIANPMGLTADTVFAAAAGKVGIGAAWVGALAYLMQIYYDFSGYSDMAIGLGEVFGFTFKENFRYPYSASSVREFWRRWHISLSTWFKEYLYIPLGGNRKGRARTILNKWIVFFFTGLWHGAGVNFIFWGLYHGFFLCMEEVLPKPKKRRPLLSHLYVLLVVTVGFVFFRADTMEKGAQLVAAMFTGFGGGAAAASFLASLLNPLTLTVFVAACLGAAPLWHRLAGHKAAEALSWVFSLGLLLLCLISLAGSTYNPFIYFRF